MMEILVALLAALVGILVGAVINALADDLPQRQNPRPPHYPNGVPRSPLAWSGLLAFLLGKRTGASVEYSAEEEKERGLSLEEIANLAYDTALGWRHPLTEIFMALLFAWLTFYQPDSGRLLIWGVYLSILMLITIIDLEHRLILFVVIVPSVALTLVLNALFPESSINGEPRHLDEYLLGAALGGGVFFVFYLGGGVFADVVAALRGRSLAEVAFGFGDVMLATLCGLMIGWKAMIFAMFITVFVGAAGAILYMTYRLVAGRRYSMYTALPYGPYIVIGTAVMLLFTEQVRDILVR